MKANELRIGNLVLNDGCICEIFHIYGGTFINCALKTKQGSQINAHYELLKPILLTKEWLIKLGYEKRVDNDTCNLFDLKIFKEKTVNALNRGQGFMCLADFIEKEGWFLDLQTQVTLKYVHQLQNLYYALTGEELSLSGT